MAWLPATPDPTLLMLSEMTPTLTPAPVAPSARACGPWWAASPCDNTDPESVPPSEPSMPACTTVRALALESAVASSNLVAGSQPATTCAGAASLVAATRMPRARSSAAADATEPLT